MSALDQAERDLADMCAVSGGLAALVNLDAAAAERWAALLLDGPGPESARTIADGLLAGAAHGVSDLLRLQRVLAEAIEAREAAERLLREVGG